MLKMPTKTLLISAAMILFAGCTTKQLPRPNAEIAELRAKEPPAVLSPSVRQFRRSGAAVV